MRLAAACLALAALTLLVPAAPGYDAWAWLQWGRDVWDLSLATQEGPAWKPLPVAITTLLVPFGDAAPELWLVVARAGAIAAVALAALLTARALRGQAPSTAVDGDRHRQLGLTVPVVLVGGAAVLLTGGFVRHAAVGDAEPLLIGLVLAAVERHTAGRRRQALAFAVAAGLVRVEVWPFLAAYVLWCQRRAAVPIAAGLLVAWFVPELLSSGELLRSADRARVPNPGQPATADVPFLEALEGALRIVILPLALLGLALRDRLALAGLGWILLVAAMSQAGFSGEPRYVLPGAALLAVGGALAATRLPSRQLLVIALLATVVFGAGRAAELSDLPSRLAYQRDLTRDLGRVIDDLGGRAAVLRCGEPAIGRYRGTLLAYTLDLPKHRVRADGQPAHLTFSSGLTEGAPLQPPPRGRTAIAGNLRWLVYSDGSDCLRD